MGAVQGSGSIASQGIPLCNIVVMKQEVGGDDLRIRNRRFARMKQLRQEGFYDQEEIMMRQPHLYHQYVGKYKSLKPHKYSTISQFFQAQALNSEYRRVISSQEQSSSPVSGHGEGERLIQQLEDITEQQLQLQEQALIDELEMLFLQGKQSSVNYQQIDNNQELDYEQDNCKERDNDESQKYFDVSDSPHEIEDADNNTGVQDF